MKSGLPDRRSAATPKHSAWNAIAKRAWEIRIAMAARRLPGNDLRRGGSKSVLQEPSVNRMCEGGCR